MYVFMNREKKAEILAEAKMSLHQRQVQMRKSRSRSAALYKRTDLIEHIAKDEKNRGNKYSYLDFVDQVSSQVV